MLYKRQKVLFNKTLFPGRWNSRDRYLGKYGIFDGYYSIHGDPVWYSVKFPDGEWWNFVIGELKTSVWK